MTFDRRLTAICLVVFLALFLGRPYTDAAPYRLKGTFGVHTYGYRMDGEDFLWLMPGANLSLYKTGTPLSLHLNTNYIGNSMDDYTGSGRARLHKGYIQYGGLGQPTNIRAGRMFIFHGVGMGVLDGIEASRRVKTGSLGTFGFTAFGGMMGPLNRRYELSDPNEDMAVGGEVKWIPAHCLFSDRSTFAVSYTGQNRDGWKYRERIGFTQYSRINRKWTWFNSFQFRTTDAPLRRWISRLRYNRDQWRGMFEVGYFSPDAGDYTWFSGFSKGRVSRVRWAVDRSFTWLEEEWSVGVDLTALVTGHAGNIIGPVLSTPWGTVGYDVSFGERAQNSGPWANLGVQVIRDVEVYARGRMFRYEFPEYGIEAEQLLMAGGGVNIIPRFLPSITLNADYSLFRNPEFERYTEVIAGVSWRFDTAGGGR